ncbi:MAG: 23S rRNA (guanosine(2251)-2'-O)-methyltransferase RlmB [Clostridia bacterium]|nr:23S rRNA (guanosine(2251)-2'-O)-methyltransferase RlmB [Clostridia bacterium]
MAFYQQFEKKNGRQRRENSGSWEEEGTRYRGQYARRNDRNDRTGYDRSEKKGTAPRGRSFTGRGKPENNRFGRPSDRRPGRFEGRDERADGRYGERREYRNDRSGFAPRERRIPEPRTYEEKSYLDFEHVPAVPVKEENLPADNLLAGRNPIREALKSGRDLEKLLVARGELSGSAREIVQMARDAKVPVQEVDKSRLDEIAPHHQGMIAYASAYAYASVEDILEVARSRGEKPFIILLDGVTDPHNLGAVIRTAECAGAHGVIVPERRSVGLTPAAVKASAGAVEFLKVARVPNLNRTIDQLKQSGIWVYALSMDGDDYESVDFREGTALVVGSEGEGISRLVMENCDQKVSLPLKGKIESLNASVAAGIVMYRVLRSRRV